MIYHHAKLKYHSNREKKVSTTSLKPNQDSTLKFKQKNTTEITIVDKCTPVLMVCHWIW